MLTSNSVINMSGESKIYIQVYKYHRVLLDTFQFDGPLNRRFDRSPGRPRPHNHLPNILMFLWWCALAWKLTSWCFSFRKFCVYWNSIYVWENVSYPGMPPLSMWLAKVTSFDQTSNCHLIRPKTPQWTLPVWMPTRIFTFTAITSRTKLRIKNDKEERKKTYENLRPDSSSSLAFYLLNHFLSDLMQSQAIWGHLFWVGERT